MVGGEFPAPVALPLVRQPVPIVQQAGWVPGPKWTGAEKRAPKGIRSPVRPAHSESIFKWIL